jgi:glycosyltransferase involved in cell wall biosynthesis
VGVDGPGELGEFAAMNKAGGARLTPRVTYISWAESCSRSDHTARELGDTSHMVYARRFGSRASTILFKYVALWFRTAKVLEQERPDAVFVMTPPLFAALPALWYTWRSGKRLVLDAHSAAFLHPRWRAWQWVQRMLCRRASTTIVHNEHIAELVRAAGGHATIVPDVPIEYAELERFSRPSDFTVAVVCSFNYDEPIAEILAAAALMPDVQFFMTGNPRHLDPRLAERVSNNVRLTGFLSTPAYGGLLTDVDAVLALTTRDHTMLRGAYEAIYQGTPVVVSDWQILRDSFSEGAAHVPNTAEGITAGIREVRARKEHYRAGAQRLRSSKLARWQSTRAAIRARITDPEHAPQQ